MRLRPRLFLCAMAAAALLAASAGARTSSEKGAQERLAYELMLGGLHVGDAMVSLDETPSGYKAGLKMAATGALKWVRAMRSSLESEGTFGPAPQPVTYRKEWVSGEFAETMTMTFDPATRTATTVSKVFNPATGAAIAQEDLPWNKDGRKRKPVPDDMRRNVFDPMAAFVAAREQLVAKGVLDATQKAPKNFRVPIYDGSRRYDIVGKADPVRTVSIGGEDRQLLPVTGKLEPVFGFNPKAEERMRDIDGKIYFTPDGKFVPVQIIVSGEVFTAVMNLAADCKADNTKCAEIEAAFTAPPTGEQRAQAP